MGTMRGIGVALRNRVDSDVRCGECSEGEAGGRLMWGLHSPET